MKLKSIEEAVYDRIKDNVRLKNGVKWIYQLLFSTLSRSKIDTELSLTERPQAFFGFHDKSPWSEDGSLLLGHDVLGDGTDERWRQGHPIGILLFSSSHWRHSTRIAETRAWNWQQGAQLQWMGAGREIVFNDFREGMCAGVVVNLNTGRERLLKYPVAAVSPDGERYASICFETFGRAMDGYGYAFEATGSASPVEPGTLICCTRKGSERHIALTDIPTRLEPCRDLEGVDFFSHCLFSPEGERLLFLRRQSRPNRRLRSELFSLDVEEGSVQRIEFEDMVSHLTWLGSEKILAYASTQEGGDGFYVADAISGEVVPWPPHPHGRDGHPHATPDGGKLVFDSYPDRTRHQSLYLWEKGDDHPRKIARLFSPMKFWGTSRVDLHPRIRADGEFIAFDAGYNGRRSLVTAKLPPSSESGQRGP